MTPIKMGIMSRMQLSITCWAVKSVSRNFIITHRINKFSEKAYTYNNQLNFNVF